MGVDRVEWNQGCLQRQGVAELFCQWAAVSVDDWKAGILSGWVAHAFGVESHRGVLGVGHQPAPVLVSEERDKSRERLARAEVGTGNMSTLERDLRRRRLGGW